MDVAGSGAELCSNRQVWVRGAVSRLWHLFLLVFVALPLISCTEGIPEFDDLGKSLEPPSGFDKADKLYIITSLTETLTISGQCDPRSDTLEVRVGEDGTWQSGASLESASYQGALDLNCFESGFQFSIENAGNYLGFTEGVEGEKNLYLKTAKDTTTSPSTSVTVRYQTAIPEVHLASDITLTEAATAQVVVSLNVASSFESSVNLETQDGEALDGADYTGVSGTLTFAAGETAKTIPVLTSHDLSYEPIETFQLSLSSPSGATLGDGLQLITINDDDTMPELFVDSLGAVTEGSPSQFVVSVSQASGFDTTFTWSTYDDSAVSSEDYTAVSPAVVTLAAGQESVTLSVNTTDDSYDETNTESFGVEISSPSQATINASYKQAVAAISDNDATPKLFLVDTNATEGMNATMTVSLDNASALDVSFSYSTRDGSATLAGSDYSQVMSSTVSISAYSNVTTITLTTGHDTIAEGNENFYVDVASLNNASAGDLEGSVEIVDDDGAPNLYISDATVTEGSQLNFVVSLSSVSASNITFDWSTADETALLSDSDYTAVSATQATIAAGQTQITLAVSSNADSKYENNEKMFVYLSSATNVNSIADGEGIGNIENDDNKPKLFIADTSITEGQTGAISVSLSAISGVDVVFAYSTREGTAASGDYSAILSTTATLSAGSQLTTFDLMTDEDISFEGNEVLYVDLSLVSGAVTGDLQGDITIIDDDTGPDLFIADASVTEGGTLEFTVSLSAVSGLDVSFDWSTADSTALTSDSDYTQVSTTRSTISAGMTAITLSVLTTDDDKYEDSEELFVNLANPTNANSIADASGLGTINNDDSTPELFITNAPTVTEGQTALFVISLSAASGLDTSFTWSTLDVTAKNSEDYSQQAATVVTIPAGDTTVTASVATTDDSYNENQETFSVELSSPVNATINGGTNPATGTIDDNDSEPNLFISDAAVTEGQTATLTVSLDQASGLDVSFAYSTRDGTALLSDSDYTQVGLTTFTIPAYSTSLTLEVITTDDATDETDETLYVDIASATGAAVGDGQGEIAISDDDGSPALYITDASVTEGGTLEFTVSLSFTSGIDVTFSWSTEDSSALLSDADYTQVVSGNGTIAAGNLSTNVMVVTTDDAKDEGSAEELFATVSSANNATIADPSGVGTITDNDDPPLLFITDASVVTEGQTSLFVVSLSSASGLDVWFTWSTSDDSALSSEDYSQQAPSVVTIASGGTLVTLAVPTTDDAFDENDGENYFVGISSPNHATIDGSSGQASGPINDNDNQPNIYINDLTITEGNTGTVTVSLDAPSGIDVVFDYSTRDGSAGSLDYTQISVTRLTIAAYSTSTTLNLVSTEDVLDENNEVFYVDLSGISGAGVGSDIANITISDDDTQPDLYISDATVTEGGTLEFVVSLSAASGLDVGFDWSTADNTALFGDSDYTQVSTTRSTISAGMTAITLSVLTIADDKHEGAEEFFVNLSNSANANSIADAQGKGTISNDDSMPGMFIADAPAVTEGQTSQFVVSLSAISGLEVTFNWSTADDVAESSEDYIQQTLSEVTIPVGSTSTTVPVPTTNDNYHESQETFFANLVTSEGADINASFSQATGTVNDNDAEPSLFITNESVTEGQTATFTVSLDQASGLPVTFQYSTRDGTATLADNDYIQVMITTMTIAAYTNAVTFAVETVDDSVNESNEMAYVDLVNPTKASISDGIGQLDISNDDGQPNLFVSDATVSEAGTLAFVVSLSSVGAQDVTFFWSTADSSAYVSDSDYTQVFSTKATITAGQLSTTVPVFTTHDELYENDELVLVNLFSATGVTGITDAQGEGLIENDDPVPDLFVTDASVNEGGTLKFTVSISAVSGLDATFSWSTSDGSASMSDSDYTQVTSTAMTIGAGGLLATLSVITGDDEVYEPDEELTVDLSGFGNVNPTDSSGLGTIVNDDLQNGLYVTNATVFEGETAQVVVSITAPEASAVTFDFSTRDNSAVQPADYNATSGRATISIGALAVTLPVSTHIDGLADGGEDFYFEIANGSVTIHNGQGVVTLNNNYAPATTDDSIYTALNTAITIPVLSNDTDADSDPLTIVGKTDGANGTVVINGDNTVTYTPNATYYGADSFTYTINDGKGGLTSGTVTVNVMTSYTWTGLAGDGSWHTPGNWCGTVTAGFCDGAGAAPAAADKAVFNSTCTNCNATITAAVSVAGVEMGTGYSGTLSQAVGGAQAETISVTGSGWIQAGGSFSGGDANIFIEPEFNLTGGSFTATSGELRLRRYEASTSDTFPLMSVGSGATFNHNSGTFHIITDQHYGIPHYTIDVPTSLTLNHLEVSSNSANNYNFLELAAGDKFIVTGNFIHSDGGTPTIVKMDIELHGDYVIGSAAKGGPEVGSVTMNSTVSQQYVHSGTGEGLHLVVNKASGSVQPASGTTSLWVQSLDLIQGSFTAPTGEMQLRRHESSTSSSFPILTVSSSSSFIHNNGTLHFNVNQSYGKPIYVIDVPTTLNLNNGKYNTRTGGGYHASIEVAPGDKLIVQGDFTQGDQGFPVQVMGTVEVQGHLTVGSGAAYFGSTQGTVVLGGTASQLYSHSGTGTTSHLEINKASGTVSPAAGTSTLSAASLNLVQGTFTAPSGTLELRRFEYSSSGTYPILTVSSGTFQHNNGVVDFNVSQQYGSPTYEIDVPGSLSLYGVAMNSRSSNLYSTIAVATGDSLVVEGDLHHSVTANDTRLAGNFVVHGDLVVGSSAGGGLGSIQFAGSNNQSVTVQAGGTPAQGLWEVNKAAGTVTQTTAVELMGSGQDLNLTAGDWDMNALALTVVDNLTLQSGTNLFTGCGTLTYGALTNNGGTIHAGDPTNLSIYNAAATEGSALNFAVSLDASSCADVSFDWSTKDGSATTADNDYTPVSLTRVTVASGVMAITLPVNSVSDSLYEHEENFFVELANPSGAGITTSQAQGRIQADGDVRPEISVYGQGTSVGEADGSAIFVVSLSTASGVDTGFSYTTWDGIAKVGEDFTETVGVATIPVGSLTVPVSVPVIDDPTDEPTESFWFEISSHPDALAGAQTTDSQAIIDNDDAPSIDIYDVTANEGETFQFLVSLTQASGKNTRFDWTTVSDSATAGDDYQATGGTQIISVGETMVTLSVPSIDDSIIEDAEAFFVNLSGLVALNAGDVSAIGTINVDASDTTPELWVLSATVSEGGTANVIVTLSGAAVSSVGFDWVTAVDTADSSDYIASGATETIVAGFSAFTIAVGSRQDQVYEGSEDFKVILSNVTGASPITTQSLVTITDDDVEPQVFVADANVNEGSTANVVVSLSGKYKEGVNFSYSTYDGTATTADGDYTATTGSTSIAGESLAVTISVPTTPDVTSEGDQTFNFGIASVSPSFTIARNPGLVTIKEPGVAISIYDTSVTESMTAIFVVSLATTSGQNVKVDWSTSAGTAAAGIDYPNSSGSLTIISGSLQGYIEVPTNEEGDIEATEQFRVHLYNALNGTVSNDMAFASLKDNEYWAWESGAVTVNSPGVYGTKGSSSPSNQPGAREAAITWTDSSGTFWLFGGFGYDEIGNLGYLNDLWKYNPSVEEWTWVSGTKVTEDSGNYVGPNYYPSSRESAAAWVDSGDNLWLFGGRNSSGLYSDLWKFNTSTSQWTLVRGDGSTNTKANFGTIGVEAGTNVPGSRRAPVGWISGTSGSEELWLFGGFGYVASGSTGALNDLWKFNTATNNWTWMAGGSTTGEPGIYDPNNGTPVPGARLYSGAWQGPNGDFWLFGGENGSASYFQDLWKFDPDTNAFTWVSGTQNTDANGSYGAKGESGTGYYPGCRQSHVTWTDSNGIMWLFGGNGYGETGAPTTFGNLNDLWRYDPATNEWAWIEGSKSLDQSGSYGSPGSPGARRWSAAWTDSVNNLWLFGGSGVDSLGIAGDLNDLWKIGGNTVLAFTPTLSIASTTMANESDGIMEFVVSLDSSSGSNVTFDWSTKPETAGSDVDFYSVSPTSESIPAGVTSVTIAVSIVQPDNLDEEDETFQVEISNVNGATLGNNISEATIVDSDPEPFIYVDDTSVTEGGTLVFTVSLSQMSGRNVGFEWTTADNGATLADNDYLAAGGAYSILAGSMTASLMVVTQSDIQVEPNEDLTVNLSALSGVQAGDVAASGTILNDDLALAIYDTSVFEGNSAEFVVSLSATPSADVTFSWSTANGSASSPSDFTGVSVTEVTISAGFQTTKVYVNVFDDGLTESSEYFYAQIVTSTVAISDSSATATVSDATSGPTPDPMTWATVPTAESNRAITMTASTASHPSGVNYQFLETSWAPGGNDSPWITETTWKATGLSPNTAYTYQVKARSQDLAGNETGLSPTHTVYTHAATPSAPTLSNATNSSVKVVINQNGNPATSTDWTNAGATQYAVQCVTPCGGQWIDPGTGSQVASAVFGSYSTWGGVNGLTITGFASPTLYEFQVQAKNADGVVTPLSPIGQGAPTQSITDTIVTAGTGDFKAKAFVSAPGVSNTEPPPNLMATESTDPNWLKTDSGALVVDQANKADLNGNYLAHTIEATISPKFRSLTSFAAEMRGVGVESYCVYYWKSATSAWQSLGAACPNTTVNTVSVTGVSPVNDYVVNINGSRRLYLAAFGTYTGGGNNTTFHSVLQSDYAEVRITGQMDVTAPAEVSNFKAKATTAPGEIELSWQNPTDADFHTLRLVRKAGSTPANKDDGTALFAEPNTSMTQFLDTGLTAGTIYYYKMFTSDDVGNWSIGVSPTVEGAGTLDPQDLAPPDVTDFHALASSSVANRVDLSWILPVVSDFDSVRILRKTETDHQATPIGDHTDGTADLVANGVTATSFYDFVPSIGVRYAYKIFVKDSAGNWSPGVVTVGSAKDHPNNAPSLDPVPDLVYLTPIGVNDPVDVGSDGGDDFDDDNHALTYSCYFDTNQDNTVAETTACTSANIANGTGFTFNSTTGVISGWDPASPGAYEFKVTGCDGQSTPLCSSYIFKVNVSDRVLMISSQDSDEHGVASVVVSLTSASASNVTFEYTVTAGTATADVDYSSAVAGVQTIPAGQLFTYVPVSLFYDREIEPDETMTVSLSNVSGVDAFSATATVSLKDDDQRLSGVVQTSAGEAHSCSVIDDGRIECWGANLKGQLGIGTNQDSLTPVTVSGITTAIQVAAGDKHSCAVLNDGRVQCWGYNQYGQLGDGTSGAGTDKNVPTFVGSITDAVQVVAGQQHSCALLVDGRVQCWGENGFGQIGDGSIISRPSPTTVSGLTADLITAGQNHNCAMLPDSTAKCWGKNTNGQLGDSTTTSSNFPVVVSGLSQVVDITAGREHSCAVLSTGGAKCWGLNGSGQLGDGTTTTRLTPADTLGVSTASGLSAGWDHTCFLLSDGSVSCTGSNSSWQLGSEGGNAFSPVPVSELGGAAIEVSSGMQHTCATMDTGQVQCWGNPISGRLGDGTLGWTPDPIVVTGIADPLQMSSGPDHACMVASDGTVKCWGYSSSGQVGDGTQTRRETPVLVNGVGVVNQVAVGSSHTCAVLSNGSIKCWGSNELGGGALGKLGHGSGGNLSLTPALVSGISSASQVSAGVLHTCAVLTSGAVQCWGDGAYGKLGNGGTADSNVPVTVSGISTATQVEVGSDFSCALLSDGTVWCWGNATSGVLGDGTVSGSALVPVKVSGLNSVVTISVGDDHTCAVVSDGSVRCWGQNNQGQLGANIASNYESTPVLMHAVSAANSVGAGGMHTCVTLKGGAVQCAGNNMKKQLGTLAVEGSTSAVINVEALKSGVTDVYLGGSQSCARTFSGHLQCWGRKDGGRLGSPYSGMTPIYVVP